MKTEYKDSHRVSDNIILFKEDFGVFNLSVVSDLLAHVDFWLTDALGQTHFSSKKVIILQSDEEPMCSEGGICHIINLATREDYWCQWVYQFSHEYCHHLINGPLTGGANGLMWFEETICELSSMFCLYRMIGYCSHHTNPCLMRYRPSVQYYLDALLKGEEDEGPLHLYIQRNLHLLTQPVYHRDIYRQIARRVLPLFLRCPSLWRIILHFGNMHERQSLALLFDHLKEEADTTYSDALERLRMLVLGS